LKCIVEYVKGVPKMVMEIDDPPEVVLIIEKVLENIFYQSLDEKDRLNHKSNLEDLRNDLDSKSNFNNKRDLV
jgi:adenylate kinase